MIPKVPSLFLLSFLGTNPAFVPVVVAAENQCFADRAELKYAIDVCFEGGLGDELCQTDTGTNVTECERMKETYGWPLNSWCVGEVTDMHFLFVEKRDFNEDISAWDTSKVTNMYEMFSYASSFNCDLSKWDTSKVWKMFGMFNGCKAFDGDISTWDTSSLTDMKVRLCI
jgi:surface protein